MRTATHLILILVTGLGLGLAIRSFRSDHAPAGRDGMGPGPDEIVYTDNGPVGDDVHPEEIENADPSHPPEDEKWLSKFELTERSGEKIASEDLLGQPYVVSFFYSTCPSICVKQNQKLKELQDEFEGDGVRFVAISVDPETDTPEKLREYAARFGADERQWLFMTGELPYIRRVGAEVFRMPVDKQFHTEKFVLIDSKGAIEGFYTWPEKRQFEKLKEKIQTMLSSSEAKGS